MKYSAMVILLLIYLKSYFQCFSQVQNQSANLNPKEPDGNPSEFQNKFPKNVPPTRLNNQSSSGNPKTENPSPIQDEKKTGFGVDILQSENSRLSSELSNKISELQLERESKHNSKSFNSKRKQIRKWRMN